MLECPSNFTEKRETKRMRSRRHTITSALITAPSGSSSLHTSSALGPNQQQASTLHNTHTTKSGLIVDQHLEIDKLRSELSRSIALLCESRRQCDKYEALIVSVKEDFTQLLTHIEQDTLEFSRELYRKSSVWSGQFFELAEAEAKLSRQVYEQEIISLSEEFRFKDQSLRAQMVLGAAASLSRLHDVCVGSESHTTDKDSQTTGRPQSSPKLARYSQTNLSFGPFVGAAMTPASVGVQTNLEVASLEELLSLELQRSALADVIVTRIESFQRDAEEQQAKAAALECRHQHLAVELMKDEKKVLTQAEVVSTQTEKEPTSENDQLPLKILQWALDSLSNFVGDAHASYCTDALLLASEKLSRSANTRTKSTWCVDLRSQAVPDNISDEEAAQLNPSRQLDVALSDLERSRSECRRLHFEIARLVTTHQQLLLRNKLLLDERDAVKQSLRIVLTQTGTLRDFAANVEGELSTIPADLSTAMGELQSPPRTQLELLLCTPTNKLERARKPTSSISPSSKDVNSGREEIQSWSREALEKTLIDERAMFAEALEKNIREIVMQKWSSPLGCEASNDTCEAASMSIKARLASLHPSLTLDTRHPTVADYQTSIFIHRSFVAEIFTALRQLPKCVAILQAALRAVICTDELKSKSAASLQPNDKVVVCSRFCKQQLEWSVDVIKASLTACGISLNPRIESREVHVSREAAPAAVRKGASR